MIINSMNGRTANRKRYGIGMAKWMDG